MPDAAPRGRVVMLVDNAVDGDSRVQKSAASVAAAGFEVFLIGRSPTGKPDEYAVGAATVRRVPVPFTLEAHRRAAAKLPRPVDLRRVDPSYARKRAEAHRREVLTRRAERQERAARGAGQVELAQLSAGIGVVRGRGKAARLAAAAAARVGRSPAVRRPPGVEAVDVKLSQALLGQRVWQRLEPRLLDYENAFAPVIEKLAPDIVHGNDYRMVGIAVRAAQRMRARGRVVRAIYDSHEFLPGITGPTPWWQVPYLAYESEYLPQADAVMTVSPVIARLLEQRHRLRVRPTVVINAPLTRGARPDVVDVRRAIGLAPDVPLLLYAGVSAAKRGLGTVVEGMRRLAECHVALVTVRNPYVAELEARADELGVSDRLHVLPYADPADVVPYLAGATLGLLPMQGEKNYDVTYMTKFFEYAQARLPVVLAPGDAMAELVRDVGNGTLFEPGSVDGLVAAVRDVLGGAARFRAAYDRPGLLDAWSWETQEQVLVEFYERVLAAAPGEPVPPVPTVGA